MIIYPNSAERSRCRLCHASIAWVLTHPNRKRAPIDRPYELKKLAYDADGHEIAELVSKTHFETCPEYDQATHKPKSKPMPKTQARLF